MNRLPWMLTITCLASGLLLAGGCGRREPEAAAPAKQEPPAAQSSSLRQQLEQLLAGAKPQPRQERSRSQVARPKRDPESALQKLNLPLAEPSSSQAEAPSAGSSTGTLVASATSTAPGPARPLGNSRLKNSKKQQEADAIFDQPSLLRIKIEIPESGMSLLRGTRGDSHANRPVAKATVIEGGHVYTNVAIHLKASVGSFRPVDAKPALTLNFDKFAPEQSFHGLHKISLNNSVQDSTFMSEKIARELFIAAGVPAPRASHAVVELNGKHLGLYVLLEGANKQFLKRYFANPKGNLYDGGFCRDISNRLGLNCGEDPKNNADLNALRAAVRSGSYAAVEKALDMDRFISMLVVEWMLCHWDGYTQNKNNWRIFDDLDSRRMVFIPHGLDQLLGAGRQAGRVSIFPGNVQGQVSQIVLRDKTGQRLYKERAAQIYTNVFRADEIAARIDEIASGVSAALAQTDPQSARSFQQRANAFKQRIVRRCEALRPLFGVPVQPLEFGSDGVLQLTGWKKSPAVSGEPLLSETRDASGKSILVINAGNSPSSSSWRTRVALGSGAYQLEGRLRVKGVTVAEGDPRSGAGLRISQRAMPKKLVGTSDWKDFKYRFDVDENGADVELICELKATAGEAWFDASSLRLVRLE